MTRVPVAQPQLTHHDQKANLAELWPLVYEAALRGAEIVVLPECPLVGWLSPASPTTAEPAPGDG